MALNKDQLRKIYGISEPTGPADQAVLARRKHHEAAARWIAKWSSPLHVICALTGLIVVLLPMFSKDWHTIIENTPIAARIFHDFSTLSGWTMVLLEIQMALFMYLNWKVDNYPGGWNLRKQRYLPNPELIIKIELYPRTQVEERIFWVGIVYEAVGAGFWLITFGVIAYFIKLGMPI